MPMNRIKQFLIENTVKYTTIEHSPAYTAMEIAESSHISGRKMSKTIIFRADDQLCMAVVPANFWVDCASLKKITRSSFVEIAQEKDFAELFPECELGAMPPFGTLFGMITFFDEKLLDTPLLSFNAGSHSQVMQMQTNDYLSLCNPVIVNISTTHRFNAA